MTLEKNENVVFKNYKAVRPLGKGSYGNVYEMYDLVNHESFALKEIPISSENVSSFMAEILPDCVVSHENIQKYHPFAISRRPAILKNLTNCRSSPKKDIHLLKNSTSLLSHTNLLRNEPSSLYNHLDPLKNHSNSLYTDTNSLYTDTNSLYTDTNLLKNDNFNVQNHLSNFEKKIIFENICQDDDEIKNNKSHSWSLGQKFKNNVTSTSKKFYMYLKTKICDFSLRDFIDFRNHLWFGMIDDDRTSLTFEGQLENQVEIPLDLYMKSVEKDKKINKKFLLELFRCIILGLGHLHSYGVAHNDLKSSNILLDSKDFFTPKIADFGMKSYCEEKHDFKNLENPYNFYDYCTSFSGCAHNDRNKVNDCKSLVYILYELLYPCKTQSEMMYLLKDLKNKKRVPNDFKILYNAEANLIETVLSDNKITASLMLTMFDNLANS